MKSKQDNFSQPIPNSIMSSFKLKRIIKIWLGKWKFENKQSLKLTKNFNNSISKISNSKIKLSNYKNNAIGPKLSMKNYVLLSKIPPLKIRNFQVNSKVWKQHSKILKLNWINQLSKDNNLEKFILIWPIKIKSLILK